MVFVRIYIPRESVSIYHWNRTTKSFYKTREKDVNENRGGKHEKVYFGCIVSDYVG